MARFNLVCIDNHNRTTVPLNRFFFKHYTQHPSDEKVGSYPSGLVCCLTYQPAKPGHFFFPSSYTPYLPLILRACSNILSLCLLTSSSCFLTSSLCLNASISCCLFIWNSSSTTASLSLSMTADSSLWRARVASICSRSLSRSPACRSYSSAITDLLGLGLGLIAGCGCGCGCGCGSAILLGIAKRPFFW